MDIGDYYSKSINGFTKNPLLAVPAFVGNILIYIITYGAMFLGIFSLYGSNIFDYSQNSTSALNNPDIGTSSMFLGVMIIVLIITWIISSFISSATIGMSKRIVLGERPDLGVALKYGKKYLLIILAVSFIFGILVAITIMPLIIGIILIAVDPSSGLGIVGLIIGGLITLILMMFIFLFFIFIFQSVIVGKKSLIGSFKDSYKTVKKNIFEVIVVLIINALIIGTISIIVALITSFLGIIPIIGLILGIIISIIVNSVIFPYFTLVLNYFYMDLKGVIPEKAEYAY
ncbi:hypothetical protein [Methanobacterium oryzae]|uniref:DUF7847 domain-containing protein n=1 Tax=Methanobacterium oryzae TaxID=69540 RepID=UPI003D1C2393